MKQLAVPKKKQLTLFQFTKGVEMPYCLQERHRSRHLDGQRKEAFGQHLPLARNQWQRNRLQTLYTMEHITSLTLRRKEIVAVCSMLTSVKCGKYQMHLCFQKYRNCFKQFHNKKNVFSETKYHLNVLNVVWMLKECHRFY